MSKQDKKVFLRIQGVGDIPLNNENAVDKLIADRFQARTASEIKSLTQIINERDDINGDSYSPRARYIVLRPQKLYEEFRAWKAKSEQKEESDINDEFWKTKCNSVDNDHLLLLSFFLSEWIQWAYSIRDPSFSCNTIRAELLNVRNAASEYLNFAARTETTRTLAQLLSLKQIRQKMTEISKSINLNSEKKIVPPMYLPDARRLIKVVPPTLSGLALRALLLIATKQVGLSLDHW